MVSLSLIDRMWGFPERGASVVLNKGGYTIKSIFANLEINLNLFWMVLGPFSGKPVAGVLFLQVPLE